MNLENQNTNITTTALSRVVPPQILEKWDTAIVDLNRNDGMFEFDNVRLRNAPSIFREQ